MLAVDTNVLVRLITRDDDEQVDAAERFVASGAWISHLVLAETSWVLSASYDLKPDVIATAMEMLLNHRSLAVQDPDVPFGKPATHALTLGIDPSLGGIPDNALANPCPIPGIRHGKGPLGHRGWAGPMPIRSHGPHTYVFQLFALDRASRLPAGFALDEAIAAIAGHAIGRARLDGTYEIR